MRRAVFVIAAIVASMTTSGGSLAHDPGGVEEKYHSSDDGWWQTCKSTGAASYDPIVAPGQLTGPHRHLFFGGRVRPDTLTTAQLRGQNASHCHWGLTRYDTHRFDAANMTGYWVPDLWADDLDADPDKEWIDAWELHAYYKLGMRAGNQEVLRIAAHNMKPFPDNMKMIAREDASGKADSGWYCSGNPHEGGGATTQQFDTIAQLMDNRAAAGLNGCGDRNVVTVDITFPQCGQYEAGTSIIKTDSENHRSHVAYPTANGCPSSHPIVFPEVKYTIKYRAQKIVGPALLSNNVSSGTDCSATQPDCFHADYLMGWDKDALQRVINLSTQEGENERTNNDLCNPTLTHNGTDSNGFPIPNCTIQQPYYPLKPDESSGPPGS